jgi:hypothetical protein
MLAGVVALAKVTVTADVVLPPIVTEPKLVCAAAVAPAAKATMPTNNAFVR